MLSSFVEALGSATPDPSRLGGKGSSLARLVKLGHRVPAGLVVTVDAFHAAMEHLDLLSAYRNLTDKPVTAGGELQLALRNKTIPSFVLDPILAMIESLDLWRSGNGVIVRSSATVEDSASSSFAGIFESYPVTARDQLEPTLREVWCSAFSPRALEYARSRGVHKVPAMAVVIQTFLPAERSGVMFTRFLAPEGVERILVEHVEGGCEKLVKGEVSPDRVWIDFQTSQPTTDPAPLAAGHAKAIADLGRRLEQSFGAPQDVEWIIFGDQLHVVQSRPITKGAAPVQSDSAIAGGAKPILTGVSASPGAAAGRAHIAFNIEHALAIERGQVLVTTMTNPDMVVAMRNACAIVTDVGGMICHAAIVSRELGIPCVVGTEKATATIERGEAITVDGSRGAVYRGTFEIRAPRAELKKMEWADLWAAWSASGSDHPPLVSTKRALAAAPVGLKTVELVPDLDLRAGEGGLWGDLERDPPATRRSKLEHYVRAIDEAARARKISEVRLRPGADTPAAELRAALDSVRSTVVVAGDDLYERPSVPLARVSAERRAQPALPAPARREEARVDAEKFFGHKPGVKRARMPSKSERARWRARLAEYDRFHRDFEEPESDREYDWLELRPEIVISPLLKSVVMPGFEMVPRVLGFHGVPPMHLKWIRCRYHMRADVFLRVWDEIVRATWDKPFMADMLYRVRKNYADWLEVANSFPKTDAAWASLSGRELVGLIDRWWPVFVEFFALNWFEQAQGDDIAAPYVEEALAENTAGLAPETDIARPSFDDIAAPTVAVMSAEYIADVDLLREALLAAGLDNPAVAEAELARGAHPEVAARVQRHLEKWSWMRDRDLLHEPWDTPARVIKTALKTQPHASQPHTDNLERNLLALGYHFELALANGRAERLHHAARFLQDLRLERENHHVRWLQCSSPVRRLAIEIERRLVELGNIQKGEIFFLQLPELLDAAAALPAPLPAALVEKMRNRRRGYLLESKHDESVARPVEEDDYY